jgi:molecular chaperone DnaK
MIPFIARSDLDTSRAHMGIWNRRKRGGPPQASGTLPYPADAETLPYSIGIETKGGRFTRVIEKGAPLPVSVTETFTTAEPNMSSIQIRPFQGEHALATRNTRLGLFEVTQIPPGDPGEPQIEVTFHVDADGAFSMTATDARTDRDLPVLER